MVTHAFRASSRRRLALAAALAAAAALTTWACDKMPLVAPTGTVITLYANNTVLPVDGSIEITAVAIENGTAPSAPAPTPAPGSGGTTPGTTPGGTTTGGSTAAAGTPVQNGTVITFTTTLGRIEPVEARTRNGQATVRLIGTGSSGVASVRAFSGGASSNELRLNVGTAAAARLELTANPTTLSSSGGTSALVARVFDTNNNPLSGVPVSFSVESGGGSFSNSNPVTDQTGTAATNFTTNRETTVVATAAGGATGTGGTTGGGTTTGPLTAKVTLRVNTASTLTVSSTTTAPVENQPVVFTITPGGGAAGTSNVIRNVVVNFGDGSSYSIGNVSGATTVSHIYQSAGTFVVNATGTDLNGETVSASTIVAVTEQLPLQVSLSAAPSTVRRGVDTVTFTAAVSGGSPIRYEWTFGDGETATTTGPTTSHFYPATTPTGAIRVRVRVFANNAGEGLGETTIIITTP